MADSQWENVIRSAKAIGRITPSADSTRRALDRTRQAICDRQAVDDPEVIRTLDGLAGVTADEGRARQVMVRIRRILLLRRKSRITTNLLRAAGVAAAIGLLLLILYSPSGSGFSSAGLTGLMKDFMAGLASFR